MGKGGVMARKRGLFIFKAVVISIFAAIVIIHIYRGSYFELPTQARERLDWFAASSKQEILLADLFPWPWDRLCHTGDYARQGDAERVLGRSLTLRESWTWFWYGTGVGSIYQLILGAEGVDNLIFLDAVGDMKIYQDDNMRGFGRGYLSMNRSEMRYDESLKRTRCVSVGPYTYKTHHYIDNKPTVYKDYGSCVNNTKTAKLRKTECGWEAADH